MAESTKAGSDRATADAVSGTSYRPAIPFGVDVAWHPGDPASDEALRQHLASQARTQVRIGRLCPQCGSSLHGRPWAHTNGGPVQVSLSRAAGHLVTALSWHRPVGIDTEVIADVARRWDPTLVLAQGEQATTPGSQARAWSAKEAVLKALGTGLTTPMSTIRLADHTVADVAAPPGLVAVLAVGMDVLTP